ncbi:hypothetical protein V1477_005692 [Vespula maculifrons]|uniref:Uncharacterized protein n=1 Tax=Vespula maculifrons TaxID=7453 RepID=A0ABD2CMS2_VESMC
MFSNKFSRYRNQILRGIYILFEEELSRSKRLQQILLLVIFIGLSNIEKGLTTLQLSIEKYRQERQQEPTKSSVYLIAGSQPQAVILPRLQAAVTAYVTPAELIAYILLIRDLRVYESEKTLIDPSLIREARGIEGIEWQAGKGSKILERNDPDTFENIPLLQEVCSSIFPRSIFNAFELKPEERDSTESIESTMCGEIVDRTFFGLAIVTVIIRSCDKSLRFYTDRFFKDIRTKKTISSTSNIINQDYEFYLGMVRVGVTAMLNDY